MSDSKRVLNNVRRGLETLKETFALDAVDLAKHRVGSKEWERVMQHRAWCKQELRELSDEFRAISDRLSNRDA